MSIVAHLHTSRLARKDSVQRSALWCACMRHFVCQSKTQSVIPINSEVVRKGNLSIDGTYVVPVVFV